MKLWKETKRANAQELIDWLLSVRMDSGWPDNWVNTIAFAELGSSSSRSDVTRSAIMQILSKMSESGKKTVDDFEVIFEERLRSNAIAGNKQLDRWKFIIPLQVTLNADIAQRTRIRILGKDFSFISLTSAERILDREKRKDLRDPEAILLHTGINVEQVPQVFLCASGQAVSWEAAWGELAPAFDALRGLIELSFDFYGRRITSSERSARRKIPHPLWMIAYKKGGSPQWVYFITDEESTAKTFDLNNARITGIKKNAAILKKEPKSRSTLSLIADCLRLYSQAMDARFRHQCFLGFWQLAEAITHSETVGGNTDKIVARIAWHGTEIGLKGSGYKESLTVLGRKRNDIVHRGIHDIEDDDINILKLACEAALNWLFRVHKSLPTTAHIEHYYRLRETNRTDFEAIRECVAYLNKNKRR